MIERVLSLSRKRSSTVASCRGRPKVTGSKIGHYAIWYAPFSLPSGLVHTFACLRTIRLSRRVNQRDQYYHFDLFATEIRTESAHMRIFR